MEGKGKGGRRSHPHPRHQQKQQQQQQQHQQHQDAPPPPPEETPQQQQKEEQENIEEQEGKEETITLTIGQLVTLLGLFGVAIIVLLVILYFIGWRLIFSIFLTLVLYFFSHFLPSTLKLFSWFALLYLYFYFFFYDSFLTTPLFYLTFVGGGILNWQYVGLCLELMELVGFVGVMKTVSNLLSVYRMGWVKLKKHVERRREE